MMHVVNTLHFFRVSTFASPRPASALASDLPLCVRSFNRGHDEYDSIESPYNTLRAQTEIVPRRSKIEERAMEDAGERTVKG